VALWTKAMPARAAKKSTPLLRSRLPARCLSVPKRRAKTKQAADQSEKATLADMRWYKAVPANRVRVAGVPGGKPRAGSAQRSGEPSSPTHRARGAMVPTSARPTRRTCRIPIAPAMVSRPLTSKLVI